LATIIAAITDTHIGSTVGLAPPRYTIHTGRRDEAVTVEQNAYQRWVYACFTDFTDYLRIRAGIRGKHRKSRLIILHLGDIIDGDHHNTPQIMPEIEDQQAAAVALLDPLARMADQMIFAYGTDAHTGGAGAFENAVVGELGNNCMIDWYHSLDIDGVTFDIAHHGRAGRRDWSSSAAGYAVEVALEYYKQGLQPPQYILRGHNHVIDDSGGKLDYTRAIALPCWQGRTSFAHKVKGGATAPNIGGIIFDTSQPDYVDFSRARYTAPQETRGYKTI